MTARKICFECDLDIGRDVVPRTGTLTAENVVGGHLAVYLCSKECLELFSLMKADMPSDVFH